MIPVDQIYFGDGRDGTTPGDCFRCCVASIMELPRERVPHFLAIGDPSEDDAWESAFIDFLAAYDLWPVTLDVGACTEADLTPVGYHIIGGMGPRGFPHAVVGLNGQMVHDPHPGRDGLDVEETWTVFASRMTEGVK